MREFAYSFKLVCKKGPERGHVMLGICSRRPSLHLEEDNGRGRRNILDCYLSCLVS